MPEINFLGRNRGPSITKKQANYIDILFDDCGFTRDQKKAKLKADFNISFTDELTLVEASKLIDELKSYKEEKSF